MSVIEDGPSLVGLPPDQLEVAKLYQAVIVGWNKRDATAFAAPFAPDGDIIGFDGSQNYGRADIEATLARIFADHPTPPYYTAIKSVRFLTPDVAIVRAIAGMIPPGQTDIEPGLNALQTLMAVRQNNQWQVAHLQTTPAQFHGRPDLVQQMTDELRQLVSR